MRLARCGRAVSKALWPVGQAGGQAGRRFLNLHEYQSKELMAEFGINTQRFRVVEEASATLAAIRELGTQPAVCAV